MKMLSLTIPVREENKWRQILTSTKGISIFREREFSQTILGLGKQVTEIMFVIAVYDMEAATLLSLRYPNKFENLDA